MTDWEGLGTNKGNELDYCKEKMMLVWTVEMAVGMERNNLIHLVGSNGNGYSLLYSFLFLI